MLLLSSLGNAASQVGLSGLEPPTSRLSGVRSNRLSYKPEYLLQACLHTLYKTSSRMVFLNRFRHPPALPCRLQHSTIGRLGLNLRVRDGNGCDPQAHRHRKFWNLFLFRPLIAPPKPPAFSVAASLLMLPEACIRSCKQACVTPAPFCPRNQLR